MSNENENPVRDSSQADENEDPMDGMQPEHEDAPPGKEMSRRDAVQRLAALPVAAFLSWPTAEQEKVRRFVDNAMRAAAEGTPFAPKFFTPAEFRTARILADMIIPRDERSGSASDAGVLEFMDFTMIDRPNARNGCDPDSPGSMRNQRPDSQSRSPTPRNRSARQSSTTLRGQRARRQQWPMESASSTASAI